MLKMHSAIFHALKSDAVRAIRFERQVCPDEIRMKLMPTFCGEEVLVDDREPENPIVEKLCFWIQENWQ